MGTSNAPVQASLPKLQIELKQALAALYQELAEEQQRLGVPCHMCGKCCNFGEYDHELWVTTLELSYLIELQGTREVTLPAICPYMNNNQCTARDGRTLGCRIFLCEMDSVEMEKLHEKYFEKVRQLAKQYQIEVEYGEFISSLKILLEMKKKKEIE